MILTLFTLIALLAISFAPGSYISDKQMRWVGIDIQSSNYIKGILSIIIILHHLSFDYEGNLFLSQFSRIGTICVALFFFLSGYGLMKQQLRNNNAFRKGFLGKRFSKLLPPFIIATVLYSAYAIYQDGWKQVLDQFIKGFPPLPTSWFVYSIIWFYLSIYLAWRISPRIRNFNILMFCSTTLYCLIVLFCLRWGGWWVNAVYAFNLGLLIASYEEKINEFFSKSKWNFYVPFAITAAITAVAFYLRLTVVYNLTLSVLVWMAFDGKKLPDYPILQKLGQYSYEIYLVQGAVITLYSLYIPLKDANSLVGILITVATSLICAYILKSVCRHIKTQ